MFRSLTKVAAGLAALAALALGGSAIAGAASSSSTGTSTQGTATQAPPSGSSNAQAPPAFNGPAPGTAAHEDAEKAVTGEAAAKAQAAAVKSVGSGSAGDVTTDYSGRGYETTVTKADGSKVEVHLDSSFNVMQGPGGPGGARGSAGAPGAPGSAGAAGSAGASGSAGAAGEPGLPA
jgi:pilus assembly protein FimV